MDGLLLKVELTDGRRVARCGLSGSGPTLWTIYPSEDAAAAAATTVHEALADGTVPPLGVGDPTVVATTIPEGTRR